MEEILGVSGLVFRYPDADRPALDGVALSVREGEFVVLCGASGCGKSTLLRHWKQELLPVGERSGEVRYRGQPLERLPPQAAAEQIGLVFQHPDHQIVMDTVWHELAFGMENLGYARADMRRRLAEIAQLFDLEPLLYRSIHELSGGQKQLINLASVLLLQPKALLLDEPCAQLDPVAAREFLEAVYRLNREFGMTVVLSEHRLEDALPLADRLIRLERGRVAFDGHPREWAQAIARGDDADPHALAYMPAPTRLFVAVSRSGAAEAAGAAGTDPAKAASASRASGEAAHPPAPPLTVREGRDWLRSLHRPTAPFAEADAGAPSPAADARSVGEALVACRDVTFRYAKEEPDVLRKLQLDVREGEWLAILGGNGAGKSTLLQLLGGLRKPSRGRIAFAERCGGRCGYLAQNPMLHFSHETVREELRHAAGQAKLAEPQAAIGRVLDRLGLAGTLDAHPHDLSGGEQQRLALAIALLPEPKLLCLDEPTKGLDPLAKRQLAAWLESLRAEGATIAMVTHDVEFAAVHATRCAMLFDGAIASEGSPESFFSRNYLYTTAMNRAARDWLPDALTVEDVMARWPFPASG